MTALLENSSLQLPSTKLGSVLALPLKESLPLPLTAVPVSTCSLCSLGQMPLLPLAFSQGTAPLAPLLPSSAQILRAQSTQTVESAITFGGPEGSDWHRGMQPPFLHLGHKPCTNVANIKLFLGQPNFVKCLLAALTPLSMSALRAPFSCFT